MKALRPVKVPPARGIVPAEETRGEVGTARVFA